MYASSSRIILKSSVELSSRSFSTTAPSAARRETFVELLQDVPGLGRTFDRLFVAPGRARNDLVPTRKARFVPFKDNSQRQIYRATEADKRRITDLLIESPNANPRGYYNGSSSVGVEEEELVDELLLKQNLINQLHLIPSKLEFKRRTINKNYSTLHGSLTLSEIKSRLESDFQISPINEIEVNWLNEKDGSRIKELSTWPLIVSLKKDPKVKVIVDIEVVRLNEGEEED
ncbi:uncharacterized protein L201_007133 [Kwoniella dendrophila CBS 6074]|uniref:Ribosomal protein L9 domain-containing protein n=1 Tax=Kwoniella dendrophila CBS 6074 TaxID=1295534 RepID=A0AAX4K4T4_9TREE